MRSYTIGTSDTINIHLDGEFYSVRKDHPKYTEITQALAEEDWEALPELISAAKAVERASEGLFRVEEGRVICRDFHGNTFEVPSVLDEEILKYQRMGLDFGRLVLFAQRLQENPSYRAVNQLFDWVKRAGLTITPEGKLLGYRSVMRVTDHNKHSVAENVRDKADYVDWRTKSFDNSIGEVVSMPRNQVDENPKHSCHPGLHVASHNYAHGFGSLHGEDRVILFVEVCPSDVVAVPENEHDKMRVCKFKVLGVSEAPVDGPTFDLEPSPSRPSLDEDELDVDWECEDDLDEDDLDEDDLDEGGWGIHY